METTSYFPAGIPAPAASYSPAVRRGGILAVSGQVGLRPRQTSAAGIGISEQTRQVFVNLRAVLAEAGASFADVVMVRVLLAREEDFAPMNEIFRETFTEPYPARTTAWVHLPFGLLVEADLLAVPAT